MHFTLQAFLGIALAYCAAATPIPTAGGLALSERGIEGQGVELLSREMGKNLKGTGKKGGGGAPRPPPNQCPICFQQFQGTYEQHVEAAHSPVGGYGRRN